MSTAQSNVYVFNKAACENVKIVIVTCDNDTIWDDVLPNTSKHFPLNNQEILHVNLLSAESANNNDDIFINPDLLYKTEIECGYPFHEEVDLPSCIPNHHNVQEIDINGDTNLFISIW